MYLCVCVFVFIAPVTVFKNYNLKNIKYPEI